MNTIQLLDITAKELGELPAVTVEAARLHRPRREISVEQCSVTINDPTNP